jgi:hypothetical protein
MMYFQNDSYPNWPNKPQIREFNGFSRSSAKLPFEKLPVFSEPLSSDTRILL